MKSLIILFIVFSSYAGFDRNFDKSQKNATADLAQILGPFPSPDSLEGQNDLNQLLYFQETRTKEQCERAKLEEKVSIRTFFDSELEDQEIKRLEAFGFFKMLKVGIYTKFLKNKFKRPRPYLTFSEINPCIKLQKDFSYPSGHAAIAKAFANALAIKFPQRAQLFFDKAEAIGLNRVISGVHYPSDIEAGKRLGDALSKKYLSDRKILLKLKEL